MYIRNSTVNYISSRSVSKKLVSRNILNLLALIVLNNYRNIVQS